ncbi:MAG: ImmA/IrrE family metallo-endopeptidase [Acidobacteriota bacterium]
MSRSIYYAEMRSLAQAKRAQYNVETAALNLRFVQGIYRNEGIKIDYWDTKRRKIRAAYFCDDGDFSVMINKSLPREPKLFALVHELKHHYKDQLLIQAGEIRCGDYNAGELIEKGAEVFAAEFIYPEAEMQLLLEELAITTENCSPESLVEVKRTCGAVVSYTFLVKRFEWLDLIERGEYSKVQFTKLEESIYGPAFYKQDWFKQSRARKTGRRVTP